MEHIRSEDEENHLILSPESAAYPLVHADCLNRFATIKYSTKCPFAAKANTWGATPWQGQVDDDANFDRIAGELEEFIRNVKTFDLDGFVIEMDGKKYGQSIESLSLCVRTVLRALSDRDPAGERCMDKKIETPEWEFRFAGENHFIITLAPCYGQNSARNTAGVNSVFIFIQPEISFTENKIPRGAELGMLRAQIRSAFAANGQDYMRETLGQIMDGNLQAPRFIKPLNPSDPPVRWWEDPIAEAEGETNA